MLKALLNIIGLGGPEYEAKVLVRDARALIDMIHGQHGAASMQKIAEQVQNSINDVHERGLNDPQYYARGITELTELNRAARTRRDNIAWSGITLAIIYIKAEILGEVGLPAQNAVTGFIQKWDHVINDDEINDGAGEV